MLLRRVGAQAHASCDHGEQKLQRPNANKIVARNFEKRFVLGIHKSTGSLHRLAGPFPDVTLLANSICLD
jgi:hypothetical protein